MADVISTLFGITPRQAELQRREDDLGLGGIFAAATLNPYAAPSVQNAYLKQQQAQFALGSMGAKGLGSLFGLQDPEVKKAADIESILSQTQEELGEDLSNPEVLFPALVNKLQAAGYGREATMAAMQGQKAIQDYRLSRAQIGKEEAQANKYSTEAAIKQAEFDPLKNVPESVKLRAYQRQAIDAGDSQLAQDLEADIKKKQYIAEAVPDREADRIILDEFKQQFGEVEGAKKYADWKNREKERVAAAGASRVEVAMGKAEDEFAKVVGKTSAERQFATYDAAQKAVENLTKIDQTLTTLKNSDARTGLGAEIFKNIDRAVALLGGKEAAKSASDTELLNALLGSEVFPQIGALGIGARGLDTPAEREFLREVMAGTISMNKDTLIRLTEIRRNIEKRAIDRYNKSIDSGEMDAFFNYAKQPKIKLQDPSVVIVGGKEVRRPANFTDIQWEAYKRDVGAE